MSQILHRFLTERKHHTYRKDHSQTDHLAEEYCALGLSPIERMTRRFELLTSLETPILLPDEQICMMRTVKKIPDCFTEAEWQEIRASHFIHELGYMSNLSPNYADTIRVGLLARYDQADEWGKRMIDAILSLTDRYRAEAERQGRLELAAVLTRVPRYGATNFYEALQFFRILHYCLWLEGDYHNTTGRFDQYMYPYLKSDIENGIHTKESALALVEDFFLSFNKDSDLYVGVQQGDNGQSMVLGGRTATGEDGFNLLSELCLIASRNLMMIDPKINLRVSRDTPLSVFELGTELTRAGLGFPQYSNDDVVIDGLVKLGYAPEDALNYVVAACWEFIIPAVGADIANIGALSFPRVIDTCLHRDLAGCDSFDDFMSAIRAEIGHECDRICEGIHDLWFVPSPLMNLLIDGGIYEGAKYNNFGIHGSGVATAADSLAAIEKYVFNEKKISPSVLIEAIDSDFEQHADILPLLRYEAPKMGNNDDNADTKAVFLLDTFADALDGRTNCRGGIFRAGTGTAMYYLWHAGEIGASPDGRRRGEPFGTNFSPSLCAKINGPLSVIRSFTKPHMERVINAGPLTLEFASSMFDTPDSIRKVATLVKTFVELGGHQLQLNAVNTEVLKAAQADPDRFRQLVVRIWGWSAYFVELDREYQDHVLRRQQYQL
jgi:formate C-acetyltransferase